MTYKQAYDKIIDAYFKDEIKPLSTNFCFCGTLCDNSNKWFGSVLDGWHYDYAGYKGDDFVRMERALLNNITNQCHPKYEDHLFNGMCAALEVLKQIHIARGEVIEDKPLVKRQLA